MENHSYQNGTKCLYFNNFKTCPNEEVGCKFLHETSEKCYFSDKCENVLCQYQHGTGFTVIRKRSKLSNTKM